jgi:hypothetical protein
MGATNPNAGGAPGGGGKGGMGMNRGPGGNAQNNPGGYPPGMSPMQGWASMDKLGQGLGSAGAYGPSAGVSQMPAPNMPGNPINATANSVGQSMGGPMGNWQSMLKGLGSGGGMPAFNLPPNFGGGHGFGMPMPGHRPDMSNFANLDMAFGKLGGGGTPMPNMTPPPPQPQEPVGGYINGQPAQWHYQAEALKKPAVNNVGLPTGGILARLYGG